MKVERGLLLGIVGFLLLVSTYLVRPYLSFVLGAVVLTFVLRPVHVRLAPRIGETYSAAVLVVLSVVAILVPFLFIIAFVVNAGLGYARSLEEQEFDFETFEEPIATYTGLEVDLQSRVRGAAEMVGETAFGGAISAFETTIHFVIGLGLLLFLLFFFVRDADRFLAWFRDVSPLAGSVTDDLTERIRGITRAVLIGHVLVAIIQGGLAGIGIAFAGISNVAFWTFVMVLLALIPLIGSFVVWAPASVYLVWTGNVVAGVGLFVYGTIVVGLSDEYLRPVLVNRYAKINPSIIIVGVLGGISVFGFMGLFVGPIIVGALKATMEVYDEHYGRSERLTAR